MNGCIIPQKEPWFKTKSAGTSVEMLQTLRMFTKNEPGWFLGIKSSSQTVC
jgi:hypothetical protein